jgi:hypothetical protein
MRYSTDERIALSCVRMFPRSDESSTSNRATHRQVA